MDVTASVMSHSSLLAGSCVPLEDHALRGRGILLGVVFAHAAERGVADGQFQEEVALEREASAGGMAVALRTRRLIDASDCGSCFARCFAITIARSRALPSTVSWTRPFLSASRGERSRPCECA